ncbi:hypothetical protein CBR_g57085 [Chara braunii]|uniref:Transposase MuDR plant domain-containing protein n=1 Tax=Chara braunii TaxID=69332 RepID=A0A388K865_CHABU|nr:hypothetical protein CBR_g57085 [Chara braunii]|eukprot:GBG66206.1 hypothetical protein CBR_g57085 [Chara braunii]
MMWSSDDGEREDDGEDTGGEFTDFEWCATTTLSQPVNEAGVLCVGQEFANIADLRKAVADDAVKNKYEYRCVKSDTARYTMKCKAENCDWWLHGSIIDGGPTCSIKSVTRHTCGDISKLSNVNAKASWVSRFIEPRLSDKPDYSPVDIVKDIYRQYGVKIRYRLAWTTKEVAKARIAGLDDDGFRNLRMYYEEVQRSNPGSRAFVQTEEGSPRFKRLFYALDACLAGFMHCCPLLGLDDTFLKTRHKGILLCATAVDVEGHLFPVAFAIVPGEDRDNWFWFLHHLCATLQS